MSKLNLATWFKVVSLLKKLWCCSSGQYYEWKYFGFIEWVDNINWPLKNLFLYDNTAVCLIGANITETSHITGTIVTGHSLLWALYTSLSCTLNASCYMPFVQSVKHWASKDILLKISCPIGLQNQSSIVSCAKNVMILLRPHLYDLG